MSVLEKYWSKIFFLAGLWTEEQARSINLQKKKKNEEKDKIKKESFYFCFSCRFCEH